MNIPRSSLFIVTACAVLVASLPVAAGQSTPQTAPAAVPPEMRLTGCLRSGSNPSGVPEPVTYTLEPIEKAPAPPTAAAPPETGKPKTATRYTLTANDTTELKAHVDHVVEITGHLKDLSSPTPAGKREPTSPKPGGAHNTFEVATLKMVAAKCP